MLGIAEIKDPIVNFDEKYAIILNIKSLNDPWSR